MTAKLAVVVDDSRDPVGALWNPPGGMHTQERHLGLSAATWRNGGSRVAIRRLKAASLHLTKI